MPLTDNEPNEPVLARYLHTIRDTSEGAFIHCDGAVKAYARDDYPLTMDAFRHRGRSAKYRKVFRLDGHLRADEWSTITSLWFRGNQLILEYLASLT